MYFRASDPGSNPGTTAKTKRDSSNGRMVGSHPTRESSNLLSRKKPTKRGMSNEKKICYLMVAIFHYSFQQQDNNEEVRVSKNLKS